MERIYLDSSASTPLLPEVWEAMGPFFFEKAGNPASNHQAGRLARQGLEDARERIAFLLGAHADEVIFTSGATEANNLALFGLAGPPPGHLLASPIEHPCVKEPLARLAQAGFQLDWLPVTSLGTVPADCLAERLQPATRLVSVMLANHETGALQPVRELAASIPDQSPTRKQGIVFHCDAAAAAGKVPISFHDLGMTSLTISAHKFHGPKGIGALLVRRQARLQPLFWGGHQQQGRRPGTEPVPLAVGMAVALELACKDMACRQDKVRRLRELFLQALREKASPVVVNGPDGARSVSEGSLSEESEGIPHILNLSFPGCRADVLLMSLDLAGVACATGSACSSGSLLPSPVLQAMALEGAVLHSAMRFSFSHLLGEEEIMEAARRIAAAVNKLRGPKEATHP